MAIQTIKVPDIGGAEGVDVIEISVKVGDVIAEVASERCFDPLREHLPVVDRSGYAHIIAPEFRELSPGVDQLPSIEGETGLVLLTLSF